MLINSAFSLTFLFGLIFSNETGLSNQQNIYSSKAYILLLKIGPNQRWEQWNIHLIKITKEEAVFCCVCALSLSTAAASHGCPNAMSLLPSHQLPAFSLKQPMTTWEPTHWLPASHQPQTQTVHLLVTSRSNRMNESRFRGHFCHLPAVWSQQSCLVSLGLNYSPIAWE